MQTEENHSRQPNLKENYWLCNFKFSSLAINETMETNSKNATQVGEAKPQAIFIVRVENINSGIKKGRKRKILL